MDARFVICARKTARLVEELSQAQWKPSPKPMPIWNANSVIQPDGWNKPYRFVALRKEKPREELESEETQQYQLFETRQYKYRVEWKFPIPGDARHRRRLLTLTPE
jgi:hypothetical protein